MTAAESVRIDASPRIDAAIDPVAAVSRLAASRLFGEYFTYERPGEWTFATAPLGQVELDTDEVRMIVAGDVTRERWIGRPVEVLERALDSLRAGCGAGPSRRAYGWIGFEFCAHSFGAERYLSGRTRLAHLMIPRIEVTITSSEVVVSGATSAELDVIEAMLNTPPGPLPIAQPTDIRADASGYRDRVVAAVAESSEGRYQKVIVSRRVELPFSVDMPASYRLGRTHNTPARSFLLRLGDLEAAGFSPELVVSVDEDGVVTTEPLAGTRAFGRGRVADLAARINLQSDPKEIVEHAVSVKTSFAEMSSIAEPGSPAVADFMTVRERGSVQHLASTVRGRLARHRTSWDALEAMFPSVTASGIPKRAGIDAVFRHDEPRGLYSGAVVTVSADGAMEAALVLRAVYQAGGAAWLRAGAGIIGQSRPEREFEETCEKLSSVAPYLVRAVDEDRPGPDSGSSVQSQASHDPRPLEMSGKSTL